MTILLASVVLHHIFEKQYLRMDWKALIPLLFVIVLSNAYLQNSIRVHSFWNNTYSLELQEVIQNNKMLLTDLAELQKMNAKNVCAVSNLDEPIGQKRVFGYCEYPVSLNLNIILFHFLQKSHGNISVMMIGNSYVMTFSEPIRAQFHKNYSEYRYYSIGGNINTRVF